MINATSHQEKIQLEHQAAALFMKLYERDTNITMRHIWHNEPSKPDVSCYRADKKLDLEIAHLYGSETEAMAILGRDISLEMQREIAQMMQEPSENRLQNALQRLLHNKAHKRYQSDNVWLVIRNASLLWQAEDIVAIKNHLRIPEHHPFEQIWLVGDFHGESGLVQLF
ncbi:hypothetical protein [Pseudoalteromonas tunicata]|jgi:hypothetical protein|uniref:Orphan protein n=1 Tax=Pseudoalteromonas tunicata D2 TaxID=87626 RepID=A4C9K2_9GAMM|nr:hypothetical protein PTUN_a2073 [Pseudoalteromonas tunicata]EAR28060.1 hypothetical protein PTD2_19632 [Pseudoalteromonas tunicata D2]